MTLSYEIIRSIQRKEKLNKELLKIPDDFFNELKIFVEEEKTRIFKNDLPDKEELEKYYNLKKMIYDIFETRLEKIMQKAYFDSKYNEKNEENMLFEEKEIYNILKSEFKKYLNNAKDLFEKRKKDTKIVIILQEIQKFMGTDMKEYGPFKENEEVELPNSIAQLLINRGIAKEK